MGRRFAGHRLTGIGKLAIETVKWGERPGGQGPGWVAARGVLTAGPGSISAGLLDAMRSRMRFRLAQARPIPVGPTWTSRTSASPSRWPATEIKLRAGASAASIRPTRSWCRDIGRRRWPGPPEGAANVRGLWNTLIPATGEDLAPAVPESHALRSLPLPPGVAGRISAN